MASDPIRILHVVTHMNRGGLETMIMNYYRHIDRTKIQFDFLTHRNDGKKDYDDEILKLGGKIYHLPPVNPIPGSDYLKKLDEFFKTHREYRVVHSHLDCLSTYPLRAAKKYGVPVRIAHSHSTSEERKDLKYLIKLNSKRQIPNYATNLFACSEKAGKWMFGNHKFHVVNNAIDCEKYLYDSELERRMRKELQLEGKLVIGHVGRFSIPKNHEFLIDIFREIHKRNSNTVLLLVGEGTLREKIEQKVQKENLERAVAFLGLREDVERVVQAMDVFVFPSLYEGLPVTLVEAQAAGLPCVVSSEITREIEITDSIQFLSLQERPKVWADVILKAVKEKEYRKELIETSGFDIKTNAEWLCEQYEEMWGRE